MRRALLVLLLLLAPALGASAQAPEPPVSERALEWLAERGHPEWGYVTNVVEAAASAGKDPKAWPSKETNAFSRLAPYGGVDGEYYSHLRIAHAAAVSGYDPRDVNGIDLIAKVRAGYSNGQSGSPTFVNDDIWAVLALRAAGIPATDEQVRASILVLKASQAPDGGWSYSLPALRGYTDVTGMALAALRAAGEDMSEFADARAFLDSTYHASSGGHDPNDGAAAGCQSTVWALHGYSALGVAERPKSLEFLRGLQRADGGIAINSGASDAFCTAEAIVVLAGAHYPLPSYQPLTPPKPAGWARENLTLAVPAPFTRAIWSLDGVEVRGARTFEHTFPSAGVTPYSLLAEGPGVRARVEGEILVQSARPQLGAFPAHVSTFRHTPLALDLRNATDPDGHIVRFAIDWGDGNWTNGSERMPAHAYALPGVHLLRLRALDNANIWSAERTVEVEAVNRAPELILPPRIVGDRVDGARLPVDATDPEGDPLNGTGVRVLRFDALGDHTVEIAVKDSFGAEARASVVVEMVNLPPSLRIEPPAAATPGDEVRLVAIARDPDGPAPRISWRLGETASEGAELIARLPAGSHTARAWATDADGALAEATMTFVVSDQPLAPSGALPEVRAFDAELRDGALHVAFDADGEVTLRWQSDIGSGTRANATSPLRVDLLGASWATATLEVERGGANVARQTGLLIPPSPAVIPPAATRTHPEPVVLSPDASTAAVHAAGEEMTPQWLRPAELTTQGASRQTPAAPWLAALVLALLAKGGRRARSE